MVEKVEEKAGKWDIYDYCDHRGINVIEDWLNHGLQVPERARMLRRLDALRENGPDLSSDLLSDTPASHIKKIRVNGRVAPRLLLCRGPVDMNAREFTLLFGCTERDRKFVPADSITRAEENRNFVIARPRERRKKRVFEESPEATTEDRQFRHAYADEQLNLSISTQIKVIRERQKMSQSTLAGKIGTKQTGISRIESANYEGWSIATLRKLAEVFDLRLRVSFEEFGTLWREVDDFNRESLQRREFDADPEFKEAEDSGHAKDILAAGAEESAGSNPQVLTIPKPNEDPERAELKSHQRFSYPTPKPPQAVGGAAGAALSA